MIIMFVKFWSKNLATLSESRRRTRASCYKVTGEQGEPPASIAICIMVIKYTKSSQSTYTEIHIPFQIYQITRKYTKWLQNILNDRKIYQMITKCTDIFNCKTLQNLPKLVFLACKCTTRQPRSYKLLGLAV
jgi:hypothetical protein